MLDHAVKGYEDVSDVSVPGEDTIRMTVIMAPTTHALVRLLTVIRGRGAQILDLRWEATSPSDDGVATLLIHISATRHPHVRAAIERIIDVKHLMVH